MQSTEKTAHPETHEDLSSKDTQEASAKPFELDTDDLEKELQEELEILGQLEAEEVHLAELSARMAAQSLLNQTIPASSQTAPGVCALAGESALGCGGGACHPVGVLPEYL